MKRNRSLEGLRAQAPPPWLMTLNRRFEAIEQDILTGPVAAIAYPGCDHTRLGELGCAGFGNIPNYGGQDWIPLKNPMGGSAIT